MFPLVKKARDANLLNRDVGPWTMTKFQHIKTLYRDAERKNKEGMLSLHEMQAVCKSVTELGEDLEAGILYEKSKEEKQEPHDSFSEWTKQPKELPRLKLRIKPVHPATHSSLVLRIPSDNIGR